jgi:hypothetical protein
MIFKNSDKFLFFSFLAIEESKIRINDHNLIVVALDFSQIEKKLSGSENSKLVRLLGLNNIRRALI